MKSRWTGMKCVNCKTIVSNAQLACFSCFSSAEAFRKGKRKALVMNFFLISLFIPSFIITLCSAELQYLPNSQPTSFHASDFDIFYPDANDLTKVRLKRSAGKEQFIAVDQTDEDLANIMIKTWNTNESFDVMSLRWGGNDSNTIFVIMGWRQLSYLPIRKNGSKFFISTDNGITWQEKTDQLRCKDQKGATTLSVSYWTEANPNMFVITDIMNTCIHVTTNLGKNFTSTETSFHPTKLQIHPRYDTIFFAHDRMVLLDNPNNINSLTFYVSFDQGKTWKYPETQVQGWKIANEEYDPRSVECREAAESNDLENDCVRVLLFRHSDSASILQIIANEYSIDGSTSPISSEVMERTYVHEFEVKSPFMFGVIYNVSPDNSSILESKRNQSLMLSFRGGKFVDVKFDSEVEPIIDFHITHVTQSQAYICVTFASNTSSLYMTGHGDGNMTLSLKNIYYINPRLGKLPIFHLGKLKINDSGEGITGIVDLHAVEGIPTVMFASQVEHDVGGNEIIVTKRTINSGMTWERLEAPIYSLIRQKHTNCLSNNCSLHLSLAFTSHSIARNPQEMLSTKFAPGHLLAVGNYGDRLFDTGMRSVFRSTDGGVHWDETLPGQLMFAVGNSGGLVVAISDWEPVSSLMYSYDFGETWSELHFNKHDEPSLKVVRILTEPSGTSTVFNIYGTTRISKITDHNWVVKRVDLKSIFEAKVCADSDFRRWSFEDAHTKAQCYLGRKTSYLRRIASRKCFIDENWSMQANVSNCKCTTDDYECDIGYQRSSEGKHACVAINNEMDACDNGATSYRGTTGFRKIPFDTCVGGLNLSLPDEVEIPCPAMRHNFSDFYTECPSTAFKCSGTKHFRATCIPRFWVCDGQIDCTNEEDELNCENNTCNSDEFQCEKSRRCILLNWRCDGQPDCSPVDVQNELDGDSDTSDEDNCVFVNCTDDQFTCDDRRQCIDKEQECDKEDDCKDGSDEEHCSYKFVPLIHGGTLPINGTCPDDMYLCLAESTYGCHPNAWRCDGTPECADGSDERDCAESEYTPIIDNPIEYDGDDEDTEDIDFDEAYREDECFKGVKFRCPATVSKRAFCIPMDLTCDGRNDCWDGSDENCVDGIVVEPERGSMLDTGAEGDEVIVEPARRSVAKSVFVAILISVLVCLFVVGAILYRQGRLPFISPRGVQFRRFHNEPVIAMTGNRSRSTGPYGDLETDDEDGFGRDSMRPSRSERREAAVTYEPESRSGRLESLVQYNGEQPTFVSFSDADPLVADKPSA